MIDKIFKEIFGRKLILVIILITVITFIISMWHRFIYIDDCWHGEEAYWLAKEGVVKTKSMEGILGFENKILLYHKLNVIIAALIIKLFGWSVYYLKSMTAFFLALFFMVFNKFIKTSSDRFTIDHFLIASFFIFVNPLIVYLGYTFRPEILVMLLGFISYFTLESYLKTLQLKWLAVAAVSAGLALFTHVNGVIFPVAGFILLLFSRQYKGLCIFSLIAGTTSLLYTYDLWQGTNFQIFLYQLKNCPTIDFGKTYFDTGILNFIANKAVNLFNEHQRFFWSDRVMAFSAIFFLALFSNIKLLSSKYRSLLIYTITLILALNLIGDHIAERYLIYYYPYMALIVAISILSLYQQHNKLMLKMGFVLLTTCHVVFVGYSFKKIFNQQENAPAIHHELSEQLHDPNAKVLAPDKFIFNEIENRPILSYHVWEYTEVLSASKIDQEKALKIASELGVQYIILDNEITNDADKPWFKNGIIKENPYFKKMMNYKNYIILKRL